MVEDSIDAFELLKEEMETDEIYLKVNAIHRLPTVIMAMGKHHAVDKLIPYLESLGHKEDDEILFAIAEELGKIWSLIDNKLLLLPILENLGSLDETVVREQAVKSLVSISEALNDSEMQNVFAPMVIRLAQGEWFTSRVSASSLFYIAYKRGGTFKDKLRKKFIDLCNEDTPMVKRGAAEKLGRFASCVEKEYVISDLIPIFKQLSGDEQDMIRVLCISSMIPLAEYLSREDNQRYILTVLLAAGEDKSWQVRMAFAKNFAALAKAFGKEITDNNLISKFSLLMKDVEADVRSEALKSLNECVSNLSVEKVASIIIPSMQTLVNDSHTNVRSSLAGSLGIVAEVVGRDISREKLVPMMVELVKDDNHDVRHGVVDSIMGIARIGGTDIITANLLSGLGNLTKDAQWRVRLDVIEVTGELAKELGREYYQKNLEHIFNTFLSDMAASVRNSGIKKLQVIANEFKGDWVVHSYLPTVVETINKEKQGYLYRMTALASLVSVIPVLNKEQVSAHVLPILLKAAKDTVPNVRFCVCKLMKIIHPSLDHTTVKSKITPALQELIVDPDKDVQYFAQVALNSI